jgi:hypothetical protein
MNVFEGSRRIALLAGGLWVLGWCISAFNYKPYVYLTYSFPGAGKPPVVSESLSYSNSICPIDSISEHKSFLTKRKTDVSVSFCFLTIENQHGNRKIALPLNPFDKFDKLAERYGGVTLYDESSPQASNYIKSVINDFEIPPKDQADAESRWWKIVASDIGSGFLWMFLGLCVLLVFTLATGWIVRGFMGIPQGLDKKLDA